MNLVQLIQQNGGQEVFSQVARKVGLQEEEASDLLARVMPVLGQGIKSKLGDPNQLQDLVSELSQGKLQDVLDKPEMIEREEVVQDGNAILGKVFGSKDVSRNVADRVAEQAGTSPDIIKQLLPVAATLLMGVLQKEGRKKGVVGEASLNDTDETTTISSVFMEFLDMDDDGDVMDDVLNLAQRFFK